MSDNDVLSRLDRYVVKQEVKLYLFYQKEMERRNYGVMIYGDRVHVWRKDVRGQEPHFMEPSPWDEV